MGRTKLYEGVTCSAEGCEESAKSKGLCDRHYKQQRYVPRPKKEPKVYQKKGLRQSSVNVEQAKTLYEAGYTYGEIGQVFGVTRERVRQKLKGIITKRPSVPKPPKPEKPAPEFDKTTHRKCCICKEVKAVTEFSRCSNKYHYGYQTICKPCKAARMRASYRAKKNAAAFVEKWT